jgi:cell division septation protein DedD
VTEERDRRISDLYRLGSQDSPPARLDRAVMDMAHKSVRRRPASPFGNRWITASALAGVVGLSVLLILTEPRQPDVLTPRKEAVAPLSESVTDAMKGPAQMLDSPLESSREHEEKRELPAAPSPRLRGFSERHDTEAIPREKAVGIVQEPAGLDAPAPTPALAANYLQAGSFRDRQRAVDLKERLEGLGFRCEIDSVAVSDSGSVHHLRVGPYDDPGALEKARRELEALGLVDRETGVPE